jgi:hypothetical protein
MFCFRRMIRSGLYQVGVCSLASSSFRHVYFSQWKVPPTRLSASYFVNLLLVPESFSLKSFVKGQNRNSSMQ